MAKLLVVDDQRNMRTTLAMMLRGAGHDVDEAENGEAAVERIAAEVYDLVLTDMKMGGTDGLDVLRSAKEISQLTEVMVMTAYGTIESAVEAMRLGACDYIQKPFTEQELLLKIQKAVEQRRLAGEMSVMAAEFRERYKFDNIIGRSGPIRDVLARIVRIAPTDATVLITGESGTGKELVARAVHANSKRANRPFVSVNCAAISETLLESELFGHVRGAFTGAVSARKGLFEEANGGTFFFDEIAETPPSFQAKMLRAIQEGEIRRLGDNKPIHVDIRMVAATNQDLKVSIEEKRFRQDLYYRLNVARFILPPLRDRREDVPLLVDFFVDKFARKMQRHVSIGEGVMDYLVNYDFPGNIRELENMIEQGVALAVNGQIQRDDVIPPEVQISRRSAGAGGGAGAGALPVAQAGGLSRSLQDVVDETERKTIEAVLRDLDGNKEKAAEILGLSSTTLWRKMKRLNVTWPS